MNPASYQLDDNFDPPSDPFTEIEELDEELLSTCCGDTSDVEIIDGLGICTCCKEHAEFKPESELE